MIRKLDSVIFETADLPGIRRFYVEIIGLDVATCERDGKTVPDESDTYVNFNIAGSLLCFEAAKAAQGGNIVVQVDNLPEFLPWLTERGVPFMKIRDNFAIIRDPEGRELILQA